MPFGINMGYKKAWFEYDGTIQLGVRMRTGDVALFMRTKATGLQAGSSSAFNLPAGTRRAQV